MWTLWFTGKYKFSGYKFLVCIIPQGKNVLEYITEVPLQNQQSSWLVCGPINSRLIVGSKIMRLGTYYLLVFTK